MKYNVKNIQDTGKPVKYLFFWGHQPSKDGSIIKSCFSQWWEDNFEIDGVEYKTAEHFMMAEKARLFDDDEIRQEIINCQSSAAAKKLGRKVQNFDQNVWEAYRFEIVKKGNYHKFAQNPALTEFLISTTKKVIVEASPYDKIWGIGMLESHNDAHNPKKWKGLNLLGFALMEVRDELKLIIK